jgi:Domain of unknown function (DUF4186)
MVQGLTRGTRRGAPWRPVARTRPAPTTFPSDPDPGRRVTAARDPPAPALSGCCRVVIGTLNRGHPVFVAQHATATYGRGRLERNHRIARGHELSDEERRYVVDVIMRLIEREVQDAPR